MSSLLEKTRDLSKQLSKAAANSQLDDMIVLLKQLKEVVEPSEELIRVRVFFFFFSDSNNTDDQDWCYRGKAAHTL